MSAKQNIDNPHERRPFKAHGHMDVVTLGDFTLGRGVFEPGWRWSDDVKPIAGTDWGAHIDEELSTFVTDDDAERDAAIVGLGPSDVVPSGPAAVHPSSEAATEDLD